MVSFVHTLYLLRSFVFRFIDATKFSVAVDLSITGSSGVLRGEFRW